MECDLLEFLIGATLDHHYNALRYDLEIRKASQLKDVKDRDLTRIGMSRYEQRQLKRYYNKRFSPNYLSKIKRLLGPGKKEESQPALFCLAEETSCPLPVELCPEQVIVLPNKHVIPTENITINKELGVGEFGVVQQGIWTNDGLRIQVAVKCLSREKMNTNSMEFLKEAAIMYSINHKSIVRLYGVVLHMDTLMLVTELAPLRSLLECLKEVSLRSSFPVLTLCDFAFQICDGMAYLENERLIHRDLAARNILVFSKNKVKISDFGLSRALGVGKNYYQTNINVNLKLPIAWCAPECISFLKFTSASDVWAFAVTLWEMFSYGFQPWAGFSGYQILVAIDEPNYQRLEQPECCPKDYYALMQKCWSHDLTKRPKFSEILHLLPDCKPEQVQAVSFSESESHTKRDQLIYRSGDVITILDKEPTISGQWKGILNNGTSGYFSPQNVVPLDSNSPPLAANQSAMKSFTRSYIQEPSGSGILRNSLLRSQGKLSNRRRLCANMISGPQGDMKHTGHVGVDGVNFGDFPFFEQNLIPRQVVTPYKPSDDLEQTPLIHPNSPSHLTGNNTTNPPSKNSDTDNNEHGTGLSSTYFNLNFDSLAKVKLSSHKNNSANNNNAKSHNDASNDFDLDKELDQPHEYQEIADGQKTLDFGKSLMEELDSIYKSHLRPNTSTSSNQDQESTNHRNEMTDQLSTRMNNNSTLTKKQVFVKPLSCKEQDMLDSAIALYHEMSTKSVTGLAENKEQPSTPTTPVAKENKFFRLPGEHSGHHTKCHKTSHTTEHSEEGIFCKEVQSVRDIQSSITEESRIAYQSLVEQSHNLLTTIMRIQDKPEMQHYDGKTKTLLRRDTVDAPDFHNSSEFLNKKAFSISDNNPLPLPPRDRTVVSMAPRKRHTRIHPLLMENPQQTVEGKYNEPVQNIPQHNSNTNSIVPQQSESHGPTVVKPVRNSIKKFESSEPNYYQNVGMKLPIKDEDCFDAPSLKFEAQIENNFTSAIEYETKAYKMPDEEEFTSGDKDISKHNDTINLNNDTKLKANVKYTLSSNTLPLPPVLNFSKLKLKGVLMDQEDSSPSGSKDSGSTNSLDNIAKEIKEPPLNTKTRSKSVDDDDTYPIDLQEDTLARGSPDRVSVEDLLKFADQKPCGRQRGTDSDEVRIMRKVLKHQVMTEISDETSLMILEFVSWNVYRAIQLARLRASSGGELQECYTALEACSWDVSRAAQLLTGNGDVTNV